jgi:hypothetical protein
VTAASLRGACAGASVSPNSQRPALRSVRKTRASHLTLHGPVHALDAAGTRDQRQPEAQRYSRNARQRHQRIAQREMSVRVLVARFQQCAAHVLPRAKQRERLVDLGHTTRVAAAKVDDKPGLPVDVS